MTYILFPKSYRLRICGWGTSRRFVLLQGRTATPNHAGRDSSSLLLCFGSLLTRVLSNLLLFFLDRFIACLLHHGGCIQDIFATSVYILTQCVSCWMVNTSHTERKYVYASFLGSAAASERNELGPRSNFQPPDNRATPRPDKLLFYGF